MEIIEVHPYNPEKRLMQKIVGLFEQGKVLAYPTDTGYAIGCLSSKKKAVQKLFLIKRQMKRYITALIFKEFRQISEYARMDNFAFKVLKSKFPGPYTFLLPAHPPISRKLELKNNEVGVRMSDGVFIQSLFEYFDEPIFNTSTQVDPDEDFTEPEELIPLMKKHGVDVFISLGEVFRSPTNVVRLIDNEIEVIRGEFKF